MMLWKTMGKGTKPCSKRQTDTKLNVPTNVIRYIFQFKKIFINGSYYVFPSSGFCLIDNQTLFRC